MPLAPESLDRVRAMWTTLAGADSFPEAGARVVINGESQICPRSWSGVVAIGDGILATVPDEAHRDALTDRLDGLEPARDWSTAFDEASERRGPARLAYADQLTGTADRVVVYDADIESIAAFLALVSEDDRDEAGIGECTSPLACVRVGGWIVAAAGYRVWLDDVAHMSVLVAPDHRGSGLATTTARAATEHAFAQGLVAQWRARLAASQAVARKLGYVEIGQQISIRL